MLKAQGRSSKDKVHLARFVLDALDGEIVDSKAEGAMTPLMEDHPAARRSDSV